MHYHPEKGLTKKVIHGIFTLKMGKMCFLHFIPL